jgi:hypothetical protein
VLYPQAPVGTVTLIEKCSGAVGFEAVATEHRWVVHISGGSVGRGDLTPDREAVGHLGSPFGRAEQMPSRPEVCGNAAEGGQEPLRLPRQFEAFHRPFALSGGLMGVLGAVEFSTDVKCCDESGGRFMLVYGTGDALERVATPVLARSFRSLRRGCLWGVTLRRAARTSGGTV